jgi:hypothetical protein
MDESEAGMTLAAGSILWARRSRDSSSPAMAAQEATMRSIVIGTRGARAGLRRGVQHDVAARATASIRSTRGP